MREIEPIKIDTSDYFCMSERGITVKHVCFFRYVEGELIYIGVIESCKVSHDKVTGKDSVMYSYNIFDAYKAKEKHDYIVKVFNTKEEAILYSNYYVNILRPALNKRLVKKEDYGIYKQTMFTDPEFTYNKGLSLLVSLLSNKYDFEIVSKVLSIPREFVEEVYDCVGNHAMTLQPYEYINKKYQVKVDKVMLKHYEEIHKVSLNKCEEIYMKIT